MKYSAPAGDGEARRALGPAPIDLEVRAIGRLPAVRERFYAITVELSAAARTDIRLRNGSVGDSPRTPQVSRNRPSSAATLGWEHDLAPNPTTGNGGQ